ncbi:hypothetical protein [Heyndrickxia sporothermodurans]
MLTKMGVAAAGTVVLAVLVAITLIPAFQCGLPEPSWMNVLPHWVSDDRSVGD